MTSRQELSNMIQYETEFGYFEKLKTQKDVRQFLKDLRENPDMMYESYLYVLYKNGLEIVCDEEDFNPKMKYTGIERMVFYGSYGETFFNAFPQMDTFASEEKSLWRIRIGTVPNEYGELVDLEEYV